MLFGGIIAVYCEELNGTYKYTWWKNADFINVNTKQKYVSFAWYRE